MNFTGTVKMNAADFTFFKSSNKFWYSPFNTHRYLKKRRPHIVLVQGLIFPLQLIALKLQLGKRCTLIVQHHGERPFSGIKRWFQKMPDRYIQAYFFTSIGNAKEWIDKKIISAHSKCFEVLEASTSFNKTDKQICKKKLGITGDYNFLWVGRLDMNKDPLTVLIAFEKYCIINPQAKLYMVFQTDDLLPQIEVLLQQKPTLQKAVCLVGKVEHDDLLTWYNAVDFYIAGSHKEGSGYSLLEAMACGCIPIVTAIPSFIKITDNGKYGLLFSAGNYASLLKKLYALPDINREEFSNQILQHFNCHLSYQSIANTIYHICTQLVSE
jgi:glycosyltransferase involved in cell wall biosynthesis